MEAVKKFLKSYKNIVLSVFVLAEIAIYITFLVIQATTDGDPIALKYSGIILCLATSAALIPVCRKDGIFLAAAMLFTAVSDLFIFVLDDYYEVGVSTFIAAQLIYFARIYLTCKKKPLISIAVRVVLIAAALIALGVTENLMPLTALAAIYFSMLLCNAADSVLLIKLSKRYVMFFVGLLLFIGCDVCVGLNNFASVGIALPKGLQEFVNIAMWAFYLPSQVLIVISAHGDSNKIAEGGL